MEIKKFELPEHLIPLFLRAKKLEWITLLYLLSVVLLMYFVMGSSHAMKSATLEDALGLVPCISFLVGANFYSRSPNSNFPYGYHRVFGIAFLAGSLALFAMGIYIITDSVTSLVDAEHATIGSIMVYNHQIWLGWVMIAALIYSSLPAMILGFKKLPIAVELHNKILFTDADAQKADYMTAFAAMAGIIGIGIGWWWADALAAIFIGFSVVKDGFTQLRTAVLDLMDRHPVHTKSGKKEEMVEKLTILVKEWNWVKDVAVRMREHGQVFFCEVFIVPNTDYGNIPQKVEEAVLKIKSVDWKLYGVTISIVVNTPQWK
ncbi:cation diffusion facilitator family transporter [Flavobacterium sp. NRK1]|uniref:cation diffusion facilitator family transporter n=1 Tax=Flavobacterium sp. NRK1 TaxID=2954929 RepID=UPI00209343D8|nr:cation diffusion facilitator family transporter [Flavobacterium sp. NRK1]MCO6149425.1 cation diffusion facilitator family transporter [Flavobacterium sp. NRK1]